MNNSGIQSVAVTVYVMISGGGKATSLDQFICFERPPYKELPGHTKPGSLHCSKKRVTLKLI